jgi:ribonuclease P protein component
MLPFKNRLTKRKDFEKTQKSGQFFSEANIALKIAINGLPDTRVGFVVGMKFAKKAVERNQAKRQLRDIFQKSLPQIKKGFDVVVMIRKHEGEKIHPDKLGGNIRSVLQKSGLVETKE